jgi:hypothetical protein
METFRQLEREAREAGRGLWAGASPITAAAREAVFVTEHGDTYHREHCPYLGKDTPIALYLFEAVEHYTACKVCKPPTLP